jgi:GTP-binding protein HflX
MAQVDRVLAEIGADTVPQLLVFNKLDLIEPERRPEQLRGVFEVDGEPVTRLFVSAAKGIGLDELRAELAQRAVAAMEQGDEAEAAQPDPRDI